MILKLLKTGFITTNTIILYWLDYSSLSRIKEISLKLQFVSLMFELHLIIKNREIIILDSEQLVFSLNT